MVLLRTMRRGRFMLRTHWSEVRQTRGATKIDGTSTGVGEVASLDDNVTRSSLELDPSTCAEAFFADDSTETDHRAMTTYQVNRLSTPTGEGCNGESSACRGRNT